MILIVLTVFVMGTLARWRAVRVRRRLESAEPLPTPEIREVPVPRAEPEPEPTQVLPEAAPVESAPCRVLCRTFRGTVNGWVGGKHPAPKARSSTAPRKPAEQPQPKPYETRRAPPSSSPRTPPSGRTPKTPAPNSARSTSTTPPTAATPRPASTGPPSCGCEDKQTAAARATALLAPIRPTAKIDQAVSDVAETLLRSYLHAAAIDGRTIRHVHRWSQGTQIQDAVRTLRTNPKAASGSAGELEAALTAHAERRDIAQELTSRALSALSTLNIREACTPNRTDALALDSFVDEGGTLYVVGESIEDPRTDPGAMPLLTALASSVVERGRRMAERSSSGRLDPPLTLVLDDIAAVAPLPQLPELLAAGTDRGLPTLALLRSREQARTRWPDAELPVQAP